MASLQPIFRDRADAGRRLADRLAAMDLDRPVIYALPRGGVPVAAEIARRLQAPLDLLLVRKIGAPGEPELALGALVEGEPPELVVNEDIRRGTGADDAYLERARRREALELERRRRLYRGSRQRIDPAGRAAVIVDDGLATGATARAALMAVRRLGAARTVLAVPVAPLRVACAMEALADDVVCLEPAARFPGVGAFYGDFHQLTDAETIGLIG